VDNAATFAETFDISLFVSSLQKQDSTRGGVAFPPVDCRPKRAAQNNLSGALSP
jgi:hypothetical protein